MGIGNILLGDEGVGVKIIKKLEEPGLSSSVKLIDGATGGFSLLSIFEIYKDCKFIIIDAIKVIDKEELDLEFNSLQRSNFLNKNINKKPDNSNNELGAKGKIYVIPLNKLYEINKKESHDLEFLSFHQTGLIDVLALLYMTSKIKIDGYLVGISIFDECKNENLLDFSMNLSPEIEEKIPNVIETVKKLI